MKSRQSTKVVGTTVVALLAALAIVATAQGRPSPLTFAPATSVQPESTYLRALHLRSQALNEKYGPTNALMLRSEAMNAKYGLGDTAQTRDVGYLQARHVRSDLLSGYGPVSTPTQTTATVAQSTSSFDFREGVIGSVALFATILVVGAAIVLTQRRQVRPLGV